MKAKLGRSLLFNCIVTFTSFLVAGCSGSENSVEELDLGTASDEILNGTNITRNDIGVVAVYFSSGAPCSGTYLGGRWVITARHCVEEAEGVSWPLFPPSAFLVTSALNPGPTRPSAASLPTGSYSTVTEVRQYSASVDVAMLKLSQALSPATVTPPAGRTGSTPGLVNSTLLCAGYGRNTNSSGYGRARKAWLRVNAIRNDPDDSDRRTDAFLTLELERNASQQIIHEGDSGGPCFLPFSSPGGGGVALASVARSIHPNVNNPTHAYAVSVATDVAWSPWIAANLASP